MNKVTCVRSVAQRDEIDATPGDMDKGLAAFASCSPSRAPRTTFTLASTDATERALAASRAGRSLYPQKLSASRTQHAAGERRRGDRM